MERGTKKAIIRTIFLEHRKGERREDRVKVAKVATNVAREGVEPGLVEPTRKEVKRDLARGGLLLGWGVPCLPPKEMF